MKTLKEYYNDLTPKQKKAFAKSCGTSLAYLSQLVNGHRDASPKLARTIHERSRSTVSLHSIRPDIWSRDQAA